MNSTLTHWKDLNGNLWSKANYTLEEATAESATLLQCHGCLDSKNLDHCNFCNYCEDCTACHDCTSCIDSAGLAHCLGCSDCFDSTGLCFCKNESDQKGRVVETALNGLGKVVKHREDCYSPKVTGSRREIVLALQTFEPTSLLKELPNA